MHITKRLSVEGPHPVDGTYELQVHGDGFAQIDLTRAEADALIAALQPKGAEQWSGPLQVLKDAKEIMSAYGYLLMRMAVAKDAQDAYDIAKRECEETTETLARLQAALRHVPMQRPATTKE